MKHDVTKEKWDRDESDLQRCHQGEKEGETCKGAKHEDKPAGRNSCAALQYHNGHGLTLDLPAGAPEVVGAMEGTITVEKSLWKGICRVLTEDPRPGPRCAGVHQIALAAAGCRVAGDYLRQGVPEEARLGARERRPGVVQDCAG